MPSPRDRAIVYACRRDSRTSSTACSLMIRRVRCTFYNRWDPSRAAWLLFPTSPLFPLPRRRSFWPLRSHQKFSRLPQRRPPYAPIKCWSSRPLPVPNPTRRQYQQARWRRRRPKRLKPKQERRLQLPKPPSPRRTRPPPQDHSLRQRGLR